MNYGGTEHTHGHDPAGTPTTMVPDIRMATIPREHQAIPKVGYPAVVPAWVVAFNPGCLYVVWHWPASYLLPALGASPLRLQRHANTYIAAAMPTWQPIIIG